jgi:hypothetical protein
MCLILTHRKIGVSNEDQVVLALMEWLNSNNFRCSDE